MVIRGLLKTTLLDYPGCVASTVFLGGCNMRCPFCHNMDIVEAGTNGDATAVSGEEYSRDEVLSFLKSRVGRLDGVCITGGEPTINADLPDFATQIKELGYKVKLDTNGTNPEMVKMLVNSGIVDYVAMDIKSSPAGYENACGVVLKYFSPIKETVEFLINCNRNDFDYEFRTTIVDRFHTETEMEEIGLLIEGAEKYYLQSYEDSEFVPDHTLGAHSKETLERFAEIASKYVKSVKIRGIL